MCCLCTSTAARAPKHAFLKLFYRCSALYRTCCIVYFQVICPRKRSCAVLQGLGGVAYCPETRALKVQDASCGRGTSHLLFPSKALQGACYGKGGTYFCPLRQAPHTRSAPCLIPTLVFEKKLRRQADQTIPKPAAISRCIPK